MLGRKELVEIYNISEDKLGKNDEKILITDIDQLTYLALSGETFGELAKIREKVLGFDRRIRGNKISGKLMDQLLSRGV